MVDSQGQFEWFHYHIFQVDSVNSDQDVINALQNNRIILSLLAFITFAPIDTDSCTASGICGTNPYCGGPPPQIGGYPGARQPPPPPTCGGSGGCGGTYGCGPYGCYRMRARGSTSFQPSAGSSSSSAIQLMRSKTKSFGPSSLDEFEDERKTINGSPFTRCLPSQVPFRRMAVHWKQCGRFSFALLKGDHRECCARNGVTSTIAGEKCLTFCDQRPGKVVQLDLSYVPCFDRFESMKSCFWNDIARLYRS
uniref:Domain of unknown function DB domain-containing protein n=1 Tax=Ditylenchus dipsaci TaxID=166011 RepID=A0A915E9N0_9BILA